MKKKVLYSTVNNVRKEERDINKNKTIKFSQNNNVFIQVSVIRNKGTWAAKTAVHVLVIKSNIFRGVSTSQGWQYLVILSDFKIGA